MQLGKRLKLMFHPGVTPNAKQKTKTMRPFEAFGALKPAKRSNSSA